MDWCSVSSVSVLVDSVCWLVGVLGTVCVCVRACVRACVRVCVLHSQLFVCVLSPLLKGVIGLIHTPVIVIIIIIISVCFILANFPTVSHRHTHADRNTDTDHKTTNRQTDRHTQKQQQQQHAHTCAHTHTRTHAHTCMHACTHTHTHTHTHIRHNRNKHGYEMTGGFERHVNLIPGQRRTSAGV